MRRKLPRALLALFAVLLFLELPGTRLIEPDEPRYAEIPREMLARGDFITPTLNDAHYLEKPPLLYWANAASLALLGDGEFAARLPTRLAALGTAALLVVELETAALPGWGLWAAVLFLSCPLGFVLGRFNLTDGVLTFGTTLTFLALRRFLLAREGGEATREWSALAGVGAGAAIAVLAKGLIGVVLPGLVFLLWIGIMGRWRRLRELLLSPAPLVFLALAAPWFVLVQRATPGFASFFFVHEHFQRFATNEAKREGPVYYFVGVFLAGFLPWTILVPRMFAPVLTRSRERLRAHADALFFALWFGAIFVFFSLSQSKLIPYILPALPAAAALAARALLTDPRPLRRPLLVHAVVITVAILGGLIAGPLTGELARYGVTAIALLGGSVLVAGSWMAVKEERHSALGTRSSRFEIRDSALSFGRAESRTSNRDARGAAECRVPSPAVVPLSAAYAVLYLGVIFALPHLSSDLSSHDLALAAARVPDARIVAYRTYPQSFAWVLRRPIVVAAYTGELGSDGVRPPERYWSGAELWRRWRAGERLVVVARRRSLHEIADSAGTMPGAIAQNRKYVVVTNVPGTR